MTKAKIGIAAQRLVTTRSILSDVDSFWLFFGFVTHSPMMEEIYT